MDVIAFGADPTGVADSTSAIDAAGAAASALGGYAPPIFFPEGVYQYSGNGLTGANIKVIGVGGTASTISLGTGKYLIDDASAWSSLTVSGICTSGGAGAIRHRYAGTNVAGHYIVKECQFLTYTAAAISNNATDMPYWDITDNTFNGANTTTTIGAALSGFTDTSCIRGNAFVNNKIHIKVGLAGDNLHIEDNEFLESSTGTNRWAVWVVPAAIGTWGYTLGSGFNVTNCKFGSEFQDATDKRVVYADEGSGTYFGDRLPVTTASTGTITNHSIDHVNVNGLVGAIPVVYTYTPNVVGLRVGPVHSQGDPFSYLLQYDAGILPLAASLYNAENIFGPVSWDTWPATETVSPPYAVTNAIGVGATIDPIGELVLRDTKESNPLIPTTSSASLANLMTTSITGWGTSSASVVGATDADGGSDAVTVTFSAGSGAVFSTLTATPSTTIPIWMDFDLKSGGGNPLTSVEIAFSVAGPRTYQRAVSIPSSGWRRFRIRWVPRAVGATPVIIIGNSTFGNTGTVLIGKVRIYQSYEPICGNEFLENVFVSGSVTSTTQFVSTVTTGTAPMSVASTTNVANLNASSLSGKTFAAPGAIGGTTPGSAAHTTISATGQVTSTLATGTAPLVIASTTPVANLTAVPATYNHSGTQATAAHVVADTVTLSGGTATVTLTGSAVFTNATSFQCVANSQTGANAVKVDQSTGTPGATIVFTGTGTDVIHYIAVGN